MFGVKKDFGYKSREAHEKTIEVKYFGLQNTATVSELLKLEGGIITRFFLQFTH